MKNQIEMPLPCMLHQPPHKKLSYQRSHQSTTFKITNTTMTTAAQKIGFL